MTADMNTGQGATAPSSPQPADVRAARIAAGLTQTQAGALVHAACRTWQQWEAGDRPMHKGLWELFQRKTRENVMTRDTTEEIQRDVAFLNEIAAYMQDDDVSEALQRIGDWKAELQSMLESRGIITEVPGAPS